MSIPYTIADHTQTSAPEIVGRHGEAPIKDPVVNMAGAEFNRHFLAAVRRDQQLLLGNGDPADKWLQALPAQPTMDGVDPKDARIAPPDIPQVPGTYTGGGQPSGDANPSSHKDKNPDDSPPPQDRSRTPKDQERDNNNDIDEKRKIRPNKLGSPSENTEVDGDLKKMQREIREVAMARMGAKTPQEKAAIEKMEADYYKDKADYYKRFTDALNDPSNTYEQAKRKAGTEPEPSERLKEYWKQVDEALRERLKRGI